MITKKIRLYEIGFINMIVELSEKAQINTDFSKSILLEFFKYGDCLTLDEFIFINQGNVILTSTVDDIRENENKSVDALFREVFKC